MKNNFIKILLLVLILSLALGIVSFLINDLSSFKTLKFNSDSFNKHYNDYHSILNMDISRDIDKIELDLINTSISVKSSDEYRIEILTNKTYEKIDDFITIKELNNSILLKEVNSNKNINSKVFIYIPENILLNLNVEAINGMLTSEVVLDNLVLDMSNGTLNLKGEKDYNINAEITNGSVNIYFDEYNATITTELVNGKYSILDEFSSMGVGLKDFSAKVGDAINFINIELVNGEININQN